jgi:NAD(P)-dependent dehydrogenase (short-subunit alcohol dehydrogenase family)
MKKISFFGGSSGLGTKVLNDLSAYDVDVVSSKNLNLKDDESILKYFTNKELDVAIIFNNLNYNCFIHKYNRDNTKILDEQISVNITGVVKLISECLKIMRNQRYGRIILASSVTVTTKVLGTGIYSSCKAFYECLVKNIALENASFGITANCIQLGYMDGGLTYTLSDDMINDTINIIPTKRLGTSQEISETIKLLINNEYINGTTIKLTGGL